MKYHTHVDEIVQEATNSLIEADRLAEAMPAEHQPAIRALISGLIGLGQALAESHRDLFARVEYKAAPPTLERPLRSPLALGME